MTDTAILLWHPLVCHSVNTIAFALDRVMWYVSSRIPKQNEFL